MTVGEIVSEIQNDLKTVNQDEWLSRRFIFKKLKSLVSYFIRQEEVWKLFKNESLFLPIDCILMEEKPLMECCNINILGCETVMVSKKTLLELMQTMYGDIIKVYNIDSEEYKKTTLGKYKITLKGEFKTNQKVFWVKDDKIVILNSEVEVISIWGLFVDKFTAKEMSECNGNKTNKNLCKSPLNEEFVCLEHLLAIVKEKALNSLLNSVRRINSDNIPNENTNIK